ncbi:MAG: alpha/beta hydrolase [Sphingomonas sp.]|uniref:alpha/beta hydrolase n=1 Tax=Sphingomonas sp. TaxID=28214 RepID=UPI001AFEABAA|nr:alpha/beta hydrolase [Sphingomonas sp.]MBO9624474.1 alpha/beta hydrolase [Sphingomonas sp.]
MLEENEVTRLPARGPIPGLLVRRLQGPGAPVLYVHGATFPSALSVGWRIDGRSWMDDLHERGFDVWAFDFAGYGGSDRPAGMQGATPCGDAEAAAEQIERVALHVLATRGTARLAVIAHSWGTIPAGMFAGARPDLVERLVLFGPIAERSAGGGGVPSSGTRLVGSDDQWRSFQAGVPAEQDPPFARAEFERWVAAYLATDPDSADRSPPSVAVPSGPDADFAQAWSGRFPYDPAVVRAPTLIVRGAWDPLARDADIAWLTRRLSGVPGGAHVVTLAGGAHRMLLEDRRQALFDAVGDYLSGR